ncbi:hypothetical protein LINPERPRIM_LOCUS16813 [Linum perenne]
MPSSFANASGIILASSSRFECAKGIWVIDSGATDQIAHSIEFLDSCYAVSHKRVSLPNGAFVLITHIGKVMLNDKLVLNDVLVIPSFQFNLLCVRKLSIHHPYTTVFYSTKCVFQDTMSSQTIGTAESRNGLYYFSASRSPVDISSRIHGCSTVFFGLWHFRLGHSSVKSLVQSLKPRCSEKFHCKICPIAQQQRLPFPCSDSLAARPFPLIHVDIW